jgi:hypothetical protein
MDASEYFEELMVGHHVGINTRFYFRYTNTHQAASEK